VPRFKVIVHRRVYKYLKKIKDRELKDRLISVILGLEDYPLILRRMDVVKLEGLEKTFRIRVGDYRIIFFVDKRNRLIYVTHLGKRESIYG